MSAGVVKAADRGILQGFVKERATVGVAVYTDDAVACRGMANLHHEAVNHLVGEYVRGQAQTNGVVSFWSLLNLAIRSLITT